MRLTWMVIALESFERRINLYYRHPHIALSGDPEMAMRSHFLVGALMILLVTSVGPATRADGPALDSDDVSRKMEKLRALAAKHRTRTTAPDSVIIHDLTPRLTDEQRSAVGEAVRRCWQEHHAPDDSVPSSVALVAELDSSGTIRVVRVSDEDVPRLDDPRFHAFADRAMRALLDTRCAPLPVPQALLASTNELRFRFRP